jgi:O-antigen ligase
MRTTLIAIIILLIYTVPTFNVGGIPIRIEDIIFVSLIIFFPKISIKYTKHLFLLLFLSVIVSFLSITIQVFKGYIPILGDLNTIFSLLRNFVIFYSALKLGSNNDIDFNKLLICLSLGFFACAIVSILQFYDIGGLGTFFYLLYGKESGIEYGINRTVGVAGNPNYAAFYQLNGLICILCLKKTRNKYFLLIFLLLSIISILSVYLTFSRTGLISLLLIFITLLLYHRKYIWLISIGALVIIMLPFLDFLLINTRYEGLINSSTQNQGGSILTLNGRLDGIWSQKMNFFYENPLFGISSAKGSISSTNFDTIIYDNSFLYLLVTGGIIGLIVNLLFNIKTIRLFQKTTDNNLKNFYKYIIILHVNIFIFYLTTDLFKAVQFTSFYFFATGILISQYKLKEKKNEPSYNNTNIKLE